MPALKSIIQFAKAPILGQVKTRLQTALSAEEALAVHCELMLTTFDLISNIDCDALFIQIAGSLEPPFFEPIKRHPKTQLQTQVAGDLGVKMCTALNQALTQTHIALLVGSDCPALNATHIAQAFECLASPQNGCDIVFIPAEDGGYVLIGSRVPLPENLFSNVAWGTEKVLRQSLDCCKHAGLKTHLLDPLWDVDYPEDLVRWRQMQA